MPTCHTIFVTAWSHCLPPPTQPVMPGSHSTSVTGSSAQANGFVHFFQNIFGTSELSVAINVGIIIILSILVALPLLDYLDYRRLRKAKLIYLELTPPGSSAKSSHANSQLFAVLNGLYSINTFTDRILRHKQPIALETVSNYEGGIRFIAGVPKETVLSFEQTVTSYLPNVRFQEVQDYIPRTFAAGTYWQLLEFRLWRHFARPLRSHDALAQHDPVSFIHNALAKPEPGELLVTQLILYPAYSREARRVHNKLILGKRPGLLEFSWKLPFVLFLKYVALQLKIIAVLMEFIGGMFFSGQSSSYPHRYERRNTKALQAIDDKMLGKLQQPLFHVDMRAFIVMKDVRRLNERSTGLIGSLASLQDPGYQALVLRRNWIIRHLRKWQEFKLSKFVNRVPSILRSNRCILSAEEVANIFHFPYGQTAQTENVVQSFSRTLAAPVAIKQRADSGDYDVALGVSKHHGTETAIGLTEDERQRHVYIIGSTGSGKTTMMEYAIVQDIRNGYGCAMVDPHGDSSRKVLKYIPKARIKDVIYLNPRDLDFPVGLNPLELPEGLTGSELEHEKDLVAEAVISILRKVFDDGTDTNAYRIERVLRNAIHTAFTVEGATLFTVLRLLTDASFRKKVTKNLQDESLKRFWKEELGKAGEFQRVKISGGPISRIERYERSIVARRMLEQPKSTINFDDILNGSKILICNFSKGRLGEDTSALFGTTILAMLQLAAWRRDELPEDKRTPFYLYVDEFQLFATQSFMGLFSEARKYKLFVTMAMQTVAQLKEQTMLNTILDNVGTLVAFRAKTPETEKLLLHQFHPPIDKGEILNLPAYNFYMKIAATQPMEPVSGETIVLSKDEASEKMAEEVVAASRKRWAIDYKSTEEEGKSNRKDRVRSDSTPKVDQAVDADDEDLETSEGLLGADSPDV